jgi:hypothetical protein
MGQFQGSETGEFWSRRWDDLAEVDAIEVMRCRTAALPVRDTAGLTD